MFYAALHNSALHGIEQQFSANSSIFAKSCLYYSQIDLSQISKYYEFIDSIPFCKCLTDPVKH